jgi:hypothetical protein
MTQLNSFQVLPAVVSALDDMQSEGHHQEECSWIAGTGKAELYVRDRLGATLAKKYPEVIVAREWGKNKHDLAILNNQALPIAVLEGKHLFDFDLFVPSYREKYRQSILKDREKLAASDAGQQLVSLLMTSFVGEVPSNLAMVFKYSIGSNKYFKKHGLGSTQLAVGEANRFLREFGTVVHERKLSTGRFYGFEVCVWMWLVNISR